MCAVGMLAKPRAVLAAARPFAGRDQREPRAARRGTMPHAGADQARLDRVAHQEDAAERERDAADPDHPLGAEALLEADGGLGAVGGWRALRRPAAPGRWRLPARVRRGARRVRPVARAAAGAGGSAVGAGVGAAGGGTATGPANRPRCGLPARRSAVPSCASGRLTPTALTSATMAMIGNDRIISPSSTNSMDAPVSAQC